jgi:RimJ/RimL family protein N-acetyltransferase
MVLQVRPWVSRGKLSRMTPPDSPVSFAAKPILDGELVQLRPVHPDDAQHYLSVDVESLRLAGTRHGQTAEQLTNWYASCATRPDRLDLAIIDRSTGEWAGEVVLIDLDQDNLSCTLRIVLAGPRFFDRGFGTETMRLVLAHAFDVVNLHRIELDVFAFNERAAHVYRKVGFRVEGIKRHTLRRGDQWIDAWTMAILRDEWEA